MKCIKILLKSILILSIATHSIVFAQAEQSEDDQSIRDYQASRPSIFTRDQFEIFINSHIQTYPGEDLAYFKPLYPIDQILTEIEKHYEKRHPNEFMFSSNGLKVEGFDEYKIDGKYVEYDLKSIVESILLAIVLAKHGFMDMAKKRLDNSIYQFFLLGSFLINKRGYSQEKVDEVFTDLFRQTIVTSLKNIDFSKNYENQNLYNLFKYFSETPLSQKNMQAKRSEILTLLSKQTVTTKFLPFIFIFLSSIAGLVGTFVGVVVLMLKNPSAGLLFSGAFGVIAGGCLAGYGAYRGSMSCARIVNSFKMKFQNTESIKWSCEQVLTESGEVVP